MTNAEVYGILSYLLQEIEKLNQQFMVLLQGQECSAVPEEEIKKKIEFVKDSNGDTTKH